MLNENLIYSDKPTKMAKNGQISQNGQMRFFMAKNGQIFQNWP